MRKAQRQASRSSGTNAFQRTGMIDLPSDLAHELRTPIAAILGYTNLMVEDFSGPPDHLEKLLVIRNHSEYLLRLANHLLSRDGASALARIAPMDPVAVVDDVIGLMRPVALAKGLSLTMEPEGLLPATIRCDEMRLRQVLINLLGNALKFTNEGSVSVSLRFVREPTPVLRIAVIDSGIGMTSEQRSLLFQPFMQVHGSSRSRGGSGLGLSTSQRLMRQLGGELSVESAEHRGSTFTIHLPTPGIDERSLAVAAPRRSAGPSGELDGLDVLVLETRSDRRLLISVLLKKAGATVTLAESGGSACVRAIAAGSANRPFDLILMDVDPPGLDGIDATRRLRSQDYRGLVVGMAEDDVARSGCLSAGMDGVLSKPLALAPLLACLDQGDHGIGGRS